jgi:murein DD-endopeptidase MepM/ murein hydrolase activator NlpD
MNPYFVPGNTVVIEHEPNLYSVYCHLKRGSVKVQLGQSLKRGQVLGLCGNSGHSSEPHLHFQLQDGPLFESSWGVEAIFENVSVMRGGSQQTIAKYRFLKGDIIDAGK